jgi:pantoate--beta-alanine ligase
MQLHTTIAALRAQLASWRAAGERIALVPTMGNLHAGHLSLVALARQQAARVVVSIFVNPLQFGVGEDYERYPRTLERDRALLEGAGVDALFAPAAAEMYPSGVAQTRIEVLPLSGMLCGASRPGHFSGVATVCAKLFHIVAPDCAVFGAKDYQQLLVIRRMVADLDLPIGIIAAPIVRETDGLAMSSRNAYLDAAERARAPLLHASLSAAVARIEAGERDCPAIETAGLDTLCEAGFRPDYFSVRRAGDLALPTATERDMIVLAAAWLGHTRLIDNLRVSLA